MVLYSIYNRDTNRILSTYKKYHVTIFYSPMYFQNILGPTQGKCYKKAHFVIYLFVQQLQRNVTMTYPIMYSL